METLSRCFAAVLTVWSLSSWAGPLQDCADQFIGGDVRNAPTLYHSDPEKPFGSDVHLCYRDDDASFFALEYWPEEFAPRWAAYKLSPENYGPNGCNTFTRKVNNCYTNAPTWQEALDCTNSTYQGDPFHPEQMLRDQKLSASAFGNTGHDRGHIAPRAAFSWHVCGTYQTFTMANMSPQRALLNQQIWSRLEAQVLTWAVDEGPIYVVTGVTFGPFPYTRFQVFADGKLDPNYLYHEGQTLQETMTRHHTLHDEYPNSSELLHPLRDAKPAKVAKEVQDMRVPTGYFKVIYRPARDGEEAKAIGFLIPHTYQNLNELTKAYGMNRGRGKNSQKDQDFWFFRSRIDLIEEASGVSFPGIPETLKASYPSNDWWNQRRTARNIRSDDCGRGTPQGVLPDSTQEERIAACTDTQSVGH